MADLELEAALKNNVTRPLQRILDQIAKLGRFVENYNDGLEDANKKQKAFFNRINQLAPSASRSFEKFEGSLNDVRQEIRDVAFDFEKASADIQNNQVNFRVDDVIRYERQIRKVEKALRIVSGEERRARIQQKIAREERALAIKKQREEIKERQRLRDALRKSRQQYQTLTEVLNGIQRVSNLVTRGISESFRLFTRGLSLVAESARTAGSFIFDTTVKFDAFRQRLAAVNRDAALTARQFNLLRQEAAESPLTSEEFIESFVRLQTLKIDQPLRAVRTLGKVAAVTGRDLRDITAAFVSLEKRPLQRLGVELDRTGLQNIIKAGDVVRVIRKDTELTRNALLEVFEERLPEVNKALEQSLDAQIKVFNSLLQEISFSFGDVAFGDQLKKDLVETNKFLKSLIGTAELFALTISQGGMEAAEAFKTLGKEISRAVDVIAQSSEFRRLSQIGGQVAREFVESFARFTLKAFRALFQGIAGIIRASLSAGVGETLKDIFVKVQRFFAKLPASARSFTALGPFSQFVNDDAIKAINNLDMATEKLTKFKKILNTEDLNLRSLLARQEGLTVEEIEKQIVILNQQRRAINNTLRDQAPLGSFLKGGDVDEVIDETSREIAALSVGLVKEIGNASLSAAKGAAEAAAPARALIDKGAEQLKRIQKNIETRALPELEKGLEKTFDRIAEGNQFEIARLNILKKQRSVIDAQIESAKMLKGVFSDTETPEERLLTLTARRLALTKQITGAVEKQAQNKNFELFRAITESEGFGGVQFRTKAFNRLFNAEEFQKTFREAALELGRPELLNQANAGDRIIEAALTTSSQGRGGQVIQSLREALANAVSKSLKVGLGDLPQKLAEDTDIGASFDKVGRALISEQILNAPLVKLRELFIAAKTGSKGLTDELQKNAEFLEFTSKALIMFNEKGGGTNDLFKRLIKNTKGFNMRLTEFARAQSRGDVEQLNERLSKLTETTRKYLKSSQGLEDVRKFYMLIANEAGTTIEEVEALAQKQKELIVDQPKEAIRLLKERNSRAADLAETTSNQSQQASVENATKRQTRNIVDQINAINQLIMAYKELTSGNFFKQFVNVLKGGLSFNGTQIQTSGGLPAASFGGAGGAGTSFGSGRSPFIPLIPQTRDSLQTGFVSTRDPSPETVVAPTVNVNFTVFATDADSFRNRLQGNGDIFAQEVAAQVQTNPTIAQQIRGTGGRQ